MSALRKTEVHNTKVRGYSIAKINGLRRSQVGRGHFDSDSTWVEVVASYSCLDCLCSPSTHFTICLR